MESQQSICISVDNFRQRTARCDLKWANEHYKAIGEATIACVNIYEPHTQNLPRSNYLRQHVHHIFVLWV